MQLLNFSATRAKSGRQTQKKKQDTIDTMTSFFDEHFNKVIMEPLPTRTHLKAILNYATVSIITGIENNIKIHFIKRLFGFINAWFDNANKDKYEKLKTRKEYFNLRKTIRSELKLVKEDILNGPIKGIFKSESKYHRWIQENREYLVPLEYDTSIPL